MYYYGKTNIICFTKWIIDLHLQVYNEMIKDLLVPGSPLAVREDANQGVVVSGLSLHQPKNAHELLQVLYRRKKQQQIFGYH